MCSWGVLDQKWGGARIGSVSKLSRARNSLGEKYLYVSEEQFVGPPRHHSGTPESTTCEAIYGISAGTGGVILNAGSQERRNHGTRVCGSPLPRRSHDNRMKLWPSLQPNGLISRATLVP